MNFRLESGNLVGIMGGSGVGKTTLLNLLHGKIKPDKGSITINGFDLNDDSEELRGIIGYVPQDDMLLEELTVFENLYFSARLCFGDYSDRQICELADRMLADLDLTGIRDLQVGDLLNKKVSGGQRKRLNIGLELMRGPAVLFVDEPTSGLSSHDSANVMNLLRKHALSGKLVICNIHQPSSDILKLFDRLWLLDKGGYMVYDGDPVEALVYFKTETSQANATESECPNCGNIDTDNILQILEVKVINTEGFPGKERQVKPAEWYEKYRKKMMPQLTGKAEKGSLPVSNFRVPGRAYQIRTFIKRNITRKIADTQFIILNLFEAPVLAFVLGFLSKYSVGHSYTFSDNKSYPVFLFIAVVVALFLGLMVSAEEIFKDRKILNREKFLNISRFSYLVSKTTVLFSVSALQTLFFVVVSNWVLEVKGMMWQHWVILFTTACYGNLIGLNISSGMKSVVSIYILIPLILVPQLLLGGAMIKFDDLHRAITKKEYVPLLGDMMATRWAYEALMVEGYRNNLYNRATFDFQAEIEQNNYYKDDLIKNLKNKAVNYILQKKNDPAEKELILRRADILKYHIADLSNITGLKYGKWIDQVNPADFNDRIADSVNVWLNKATSWFIAENRFWYRMKNEAESRLLERLGEKTLKKLPTAFNNTKLEDIVKNQASLMEPSYYESSEKWIQKSMPIYMKPTSRIGRAHFYAPYKQTGNVKVTTMWFNIAAIWIMTILFAVALYYDLLRKFLEWLAKISEPFTKQFGRANT
jgi:ABC-type multidrug transport system ATPase subunit